MPSAGEMLFGNYIRNIQIPTFYANSQSGYTEGIPIFKSFEVLNDS